MICTHHRALKRLGLSNNNIRALIIDNQLDGMLTEKSFLVDDHAINEYLRGDD